MEEALLGPVRCYDVAIQFCCSVLALFHTGATPGSLFTTTDIPSFLKFGDLRIIRRKSKSKVNPTSGTLKTVGFDLSFPVHSFSGQNEKQHVTVRHKISTAETKEGVLYDFGLYLVATLLRRGQLAGDPTLDDVWNADEEEVTVKPGCYGDPVFVSSTQSGFYMGEMPASDNGFRHMLQKAQLQKRLSGDLSWADYYENIDYEFTTAAILATSKEDHMMDAARPFLALTKVKETDAIKSDPQLRILARDFNDLAWCLKSRSNAWTRRSEFREHYHDKPEAAYEVFHIVRTLFLKRYRHIILQQEESSMLLQDLDDVTNSEEVRSRVTSLAGGVSTLPQDLAQLGGKAERLLQAARTEIAYEMDSLRLDPVGVFEKCDDFESENDVDAGFSEYSDETDYVRDDVFHDDASAQAQVPEDQDQADAFDDHDEITDDDLEMFSGASILDAQSVSSTVPDHSV
ncbi:hypothetical protein QFC20_006527 [Naganishia adeliensis]|uniref:Uncharacterized protein n=1 Tax=Naganishia adeliensis TaxID=92952 RepID=A0ACC2VAM1_9TREE|nr:hypothetical protein QFC20_006527 [Naganishia adeliensis]